MNFIEVLSELYHNDVRYLLVGGFAFSFLVQPRTTKDIDIIVDQSPENVKKLDLTLHKLGYQCRLPLKTEILADPASLEQLRDQRNLLAFSFLKNNDLLDVLDIVLFYPFNFDDAYSRRRTFSYRKDDRDFLVFTVSPEDLIAMKAGTGRKQDEADVEKLLALTELKTREED